MRCITDSEFTEWLSGFGVKLVAHDNLEFSYMSRKEHVLLAYLPKNAAALNFFAGWLGRWLPNGRDRVLWLKHWMTYPPDREVLFEKFRLGCGDGRPIGKAPGHLFRSIPSSQFDQRTPSEIEEDAALLGTVLLVMLFDWKAFIVAEGHDEYIYLADECVAFSSPDRAKLEILAGELKGLECEVSWTKAV
jgi:hypothetical protein